MEFRMFIKKENFFGIQQLLKKYNYNISGSIVDDKEHVLIIFIRTKEAYIDYNSELYRKTELKDPNKFFGKTSEYNYSLLESKIYEFKLGESEAITFLKNLGYTIIKTF